MNSCVSEGYIEASSVQGLFCVSSGRNCIVLAELKQPAKGDYRPEQDARSGICMISRPAGIDLDSFPQNAWRKLSKEVLLEEERILVSAWRPAGRPAAAVQALRAYLHPGTRL